MINVINIHGGKHEYFPNKNYGPNSADNDRFSLRSSPTTTALPTATATKQTVNPVVTEAPIVPTAEGVSAAPTEPEPAMVPTSRGPDLVASDPSMVNLASGQLQLVEFFSFT